MTLSEYIDFEAAFDLEFDIDLRPTDEDLEVMAHEGFEEFDPWIESNPLAGFEVGPIPF